MTCGYGLLTAGWLLVLPVPDTSSGCPSVALVAPVTALGAPVSSQVTALLEFVLVSG